MEVRRRMLQGTGGGAADRVAFAVVVTAASRSSQRAVIRGSDPLPLIPSMNPAPVGPARGTLRRIGFDGAPPAIGRPPELSGFRDPYRTISGRLDQLEELHPRRIPGAEHPASPR